MRKAIYRNSLLTLLAPCVLFLAGCGTPTPPAPTPPTPPKTGTPPRPATPAITIDTHTIRTPRPLVAHVAKVDLTRRDTEVVCAAAADPDGSGPATTQLLTPTILFTNAALTLAVNANAFSVVTPVKTGSAGMYVERAAARFSGMVVSGGRVLNNAERHFVSFWIDERGRPNIGMPGTGDRIREGVAGFGRLLDGGRVVPSPADHALAPRTAVGFSADRRALWLVVVDGRDPGVSEGMSTFELAEYMRSLGASEALNLDGGGSSVMLYTPPGKDRAVVNIINRPSTRFFGQPVMRPVPVLLGVRQRARP